MIRFLLALYPREWRRSYGEEFAALLEETPLSPRVVLDVALQAATLHARVHRTVLLVFTAVLVSVGLEVVANVTGLTANILWPPTTPVRALALGALFTPWLALVVRSCRYRVAHHSISS